MGKVSQIPWARVPDAIEAFRQHYERSPQDCLSYAEMALSVDRLQMAAIAARAFSRLSTPADAESVTLRICERAYRLANQHTTAGRIPEQVEVLQAAYVAADDRQDLLDLCKARIDALLREELARPTGHEARLDVLLEFPGAEPNTLAQGFDQLVDRGEHTAAGRLAELLADRLPDATAKVSFARHLRKLCGQLTESGGLLYAAGYLRALRRATSDEQLVKPIPQKLLQRLLSQLTTLLREGSDWDGINSLAECVLEIEPGHPLASRARGLFLALAGRRADSTAQLDAMHRAAPKDWKWILIEARRCHSQRLDDSALHLYEWLKRIGRAEREAEKVIYVIRRDRIRLLREIRTGTNEQVLAAAEAVLEIDPEERNALVAGARALVRLQDYERARTMLDKLVTMEPAHGTAQRMLALIEPRLKVNAKEGSARL